MSLEPLLEADVRRGLSASQRWLPSALLYDDLGSALFEAITLLPEYALTRTDLSMLEHHASAYLSLLPGPVEVVELGPGAGRKAMVLLRALLAVQPSARFVGIDVSAAALEGCSRALQTLPGLATEGIEATYLEGLARVSRTGSSRLVCFLGSNLSNFDRAEAAAFFRKVRLTLRPGDAMLVAVDLEKPASQVLPAYDDALGVTAAFNLNVLVRLQREAFSTLPLDAFEHRARWNENERRVEMHLEAVKPVSGSVLGIPVQLKVGETLWTESSHRFSVEELTTWGLKAGFRVARLEVSSAWAFAQVLYVVEPHTEKGAAQP